MIPPWYRRRNWLDLWGYGECLENKLLYEERVRMLWADRRETTHSLLQLLDIMHLHGQYKLAEAIAWRVVGAAGPDHTWAGESILLHLQIEGLVVDLKGWYRARLVQRVLTLEGFLTCSREEEWHTKP